MLSTLGSIASQNKTIAILDSTNNAVSDSSSPYGSANVSAESSFSINKNCILKEIIFRPFPLLAGNSDTKVKIQIYNYSSVLYTSELLLTQPSNPIILPNINITAYTVHRLQIFAFDSTGTQTSYLNTPEYYSTDAISNSDNGATLTVIKGLYKNGVLDSSGGENKTLVYKLKIEF